MGLKEPGGLALPKVRKAKRLPRVLSQDQVARLIHRCDLYDKALLATSLPQGHRSPLFGK